jgi:hypothetical protein
MKVIEEELANDSDSDAELSSSSSTCDTTRINCGLPRDMTE